MKYCRGPEPIRVRWAVTRVIPLAVRPLPPAYCVTESRRGGCQLAAISPSLSLVPSLFVVPSSTPRSSFILYLPFSSHPRSAFVLRCVGQFRYRISDFRFLSLSFLPASASSSSRQRQAFVQAQWASAGVSRFEPSKKSGTNNLPAPSTAAASAAARETVRFGRGPKKLPFASLFLSSALEVLVFDLILFPICASLPVFPGFPLLCSILIPFSR